MTVVPGSASAKDILVPAGRHLYLERAGDPEPLTYAIDNIRQLVGKKPMFGICLGHQLLGLAFGAKTFKLKFGHRGANQPVLNKATGQVEITTQNHGFAVDPATLPKDVEATHINLNDNTLEGMRHKRHPVFSVQYHPEASAGPHDSTYLFEEFRKLMDKVGGGLAPRVLVTQCPLLVSELRRSEQHRPASTRGGERTNYRYLSACFLKKSRLLIRPYLRRRPQKRRSRPAAPRPNAPSSIT